MSQSSDKAINILLLGETGAGKSTTLNALANYLKFDGDYKKILVSSNELEEVIPTHFTLSDPTTGNPVVIGSNSDENERQMAGMSATIAPISYMFNFEHISIRVIDTPGIGDTAGTEEDKANFDQILLHLQTHQKLNAILFVVKNSDARATAFFKYCISQLLLHLHKSVTANIIFCFTHSRSYMFGPGDGFRTLQAFLDNDYKEANLKLVAGTNCFFIDNDSFRILMAKRQGVSIDEDTELEYRSSWNKSVAQVKKMLQTIISLTPHNLTETVSLNRASKIILELAQPMIKMQTTIKRNIEEIEANKNKNLTLNELVNTKIYDLQSIKLAKPSTVCDGCYKWIDGKIVYKTCHENCWCWFVKDNQTDCYMLRWCKAMSGGNCKNCRCSYRKHKHISYKYEEVRRPGIDQKKLDEINQAPTEIAKIELALKELKTTQEEFNIELNTIRMISAKFGYLLRNNAFAHKKVFEDYLQNLISEEMKNEHPNVEPLKRLKDELDQVVLDLTNSIEQGQESHVRLEDIPALKQQLLNLQHNGTNFCQILETNERIKEEKFKYQEKKVPFVVKNLFWQFGSVANH